MIVVVIVNVIEIVIVLPNKIVMVIVFVVLN